MYLYTNPDERLTNIFFLPFDRNEGEGSVVGELLVLAHVYKLHHRDSELLLENRRRARTVPKGK